MRKLHIYIGSKNFKSTAFQKNNTIGSSPPDLFNFGSGPVNCERKGHLIITAAALLYSLHFLNSSGLRAGVHHPNTERLP